MRILITGICGFVGSTLADALASKYEIIGIDNLCRRGSEKNVDVLKKTGVHVVIGDVKNQNDLASLPKVDWVIDAAANPSVLAGADGKTTSRALVEDNLEGTLEILEYCKTWNAGLILLSTSRVYSLHSLMSLPLQKKDQRFVLNAGESFLGLSDRGICEQFPTEPPLSLYGSSKLASEVMALEYGSTFDFPVYVNRCGVLAGAGQFGKGDQGIFSFWIHSYARKKPLQYFGFGGYQTRDCLHPRDLVLLLEKQMQNSDTDLPRVVNVGGGARNSASLLELSDWCEKEFGKHEIKIDSEKRKFDVPWLILDSSLAEATWGWSVQTSLESIFEEIACYAETHPHWLEACS